MASTICVRFKEVSSCLPANCQQSRCNRLFGLFGTHIVRADRLVDVMCCHEPCFKPRNVAPLGMQRAALEVECAGSITVPIAAQGHFLGSA